MNIAVGRYVPGNSIIHRLDPRTKFALLILFFVIIFWPGLNLECYLLAIVTIISLALISAIPLSRLFKPLKMMWIMLLFLLVINIFIQREGMLLVDINGFKIYARAITNTLMVVVRMFLLIALSTILTTTTKPLDLTFALEWYFAPLKKVRFPAHEMAMIISLALRFIPTIMEDAQRIMKAQASRGVDFIRGNFFEKMKGVISLIIPLFVSAFERADELALAMDARGYDSRQKRTRFRQFSFRFKDLIAVLIVLSILAATILLIKYQFIPVDEYARRIKEAL